MSTEDCHGEVMGPLRLTHPTDIKGAVRKVTAFQQSPRSFAGELASRGHSTCDQVQRVES
jgi:hypothetical protein